LTFATRLEHVRRGEAFRIELWQRDVAVEQGDGGAVGQAVVGRLARLRRHASAYLPMMLYDASKVWMSMPGPSTVADFLAQLQGRVDGALRVILGRPELDVRLR
jgi:hypothetical protein